MERPSTGPGLGLAVVIPTFNERENVLPLLEKLRQRMDGIDWEAIFVDDDSPDGTAAAVREIARTDRRVRVIQRVRRHGLSSACIEGMLATAAPYIAVMDADLQHDESVLPRMYELIRAEKLDVVVASRKIEGGSMGEFAKRRVLLSGLGTTLSRLVLKVKVSDPMSGFFLVDRRFFEEVVYRLSGLGFKVLVDLIASAKRPVRVGEVPYRFGQREHGTSKLDFNVELEYLQLLLDKAMGDLIPARFVMFVLVGGLGILVHLAVLAALYFTGKLDFLRAQAVATLAAMTFNFLVNNLTTFRDRRLRGLQLIRGLLIYYAACTIGAISNFAFARFLFAGGLPWYVAGVMGMAVSSVWNYGVNVLLTWRRDTRQLQRRVAQNRIGSGMKTEDGELRGAPSETA